MLTALPQHTHTASRHGAYAQGQIIKFTFHYTTNVLSTLLLNHTQNKSKLLLGKQTTIIIWPTESPFSISHTTASFEIPTYYSFVITFHLFWCLYYIKAKEKKSHGFKNH